MSSLSLSFSFFLCAPYLLSSSVFIELCPRFLIVLCTLPFLLLFCCCHCSFSAALYVGSLNACVRYHRVSCILPVFIKWCPVTMQYDIIHNTAISFYYFLMLMLTTFFLCDSLPVDPSHLYHTLTSIFVIVILITTVSTVRYDNPREHRHLHSGCRAAARDDWRGHHSRGRVSYGIHRCFDQQPRCVSTYSSTIFLHGLVILNAIL